jgi:hypothetical protein
MKTYQTFISEEFLLKNLNFEVFNFPNLNKGYLKINKICLILFIFLRFLIDDFNFDITLKNNLKKIFYTINDIILNILDNLIFPFINTLVNKPISNNNSINNNNNNNTYSFSNISSNTNYHIEKFRENYEKYLLESKNSNRIKKSKRDFVITIIKSCENTLNVIKNFSK